MNHSTPCQIVQTAAVMAVATGNGNRASRAGCKNPRQPVSSAMPTKGIMMRNPSGMRYHGASNRTPQVSAKTSAAAANPPVTSIAATGRGVWKIRRTYAPTGIRSCRRRTKNKQMHGAGVENSIPITA